MERNSEYLLKAAESTAGLQDAISVISRVLNIIVFVANVTVILVMFIKCSKFRRTRRYDDYNGIKTLSKALEVIVIFLIIDAVYGLTRIFPIIDVMTLINSLIPDFPQAIFAYLIFITVALPIIGCMISIFAWSYYHKTRRLFFSVYPNGVQQVDLSRPAYIPDDSLFGSNTEANISFSANDKKPAPPFGENMDAGLADMGAQGFYAKASAVNSRSTAGANNANGTNNAYSMNGTNNAKGANNAYSMNSTNNAGNASSVNNAVNTASAMNTVGRGSPNYTANANAVNNAAYAGGAGNAVNNRSKAQASDELFGTGVSDDYINRFTAADQEKLDQLLVQDTPDTEYKVTPAQNNDGDIFGTGSNLWEAVPDMSDPLISEILVTEEAPKDEVYRDGENSVFGSGTTEDYMKRFTTADDDVISELLIRDDREEQ